MVCYQQSKKNLIEDTDYIWEKICEKEFKKCERPEEDESWRDLYYVNFKLLIIFEILNIFFFNRGKRMKENRRLKEYEVKYHPNKPANPKNVKPKQQQ